MDLYEGRQCAKDARHGGLRTKAKGECVACRREALKAWKAANKDRVAEQKRRARARKPVKVSYKKSAASPKTRAVGRYLTSVYRANKINRLPAWVNSSELLDIYKIAVYLQDTLERQIHVDHIVPLKGSNVSGLHVPWNLQILTAEDNIRKYNRYD